MTFFGESAGRTDVHHQEEVRHAHDHLHESPSLMTVPLLVLAAFSVFLFWSVNPMSEGWIGEVVTQKDVWMTAVPVSETTMEEAPAVHGMPEESAHEATTDAHGEEGEHGGVAHTAHGIAVVLSLCVAGAGILLAILFYPAGRLSSSRFAQGMFAQVLARKYGFDEFYHFAFVKNLLRINRFAAAFDNRIVDGAVNGIGHGLGSGRYSFTWLSGAIDRYVVDGMVHGVARVLQGFGQMFRRLQTGMIQSYLLVVFTGLALLIFLFSALTRTP